MESKNVELNPVPEINKVNADKQEIIVTHALGLQDLYKAAFSQETIDDSNTLVSKEIKESSLDVNETKYFVEAAKISNDNEKDVGIYKGQSFDEPYQLYSLKGLEYSVDFVKAEQQAIDLQPLTFEDTKIQGAGVISNTILTCPYESYQNDSDSVLDLDKGIQIHLIKADGTPIDTTASTTNSSSSLTYNYDNCEYTGDAQILQRYLCDSANVLCNSGTISNSTVETVSLDFINKQNNNVPDVEKSFNDSDSVGVNPETLGVRFEDCDFNSSDSFASTESIIPKNILCGKCPKKFMFKSDLLRHDKYKHSVKPKLSCKYCNKEFVSQQNLLFHEKSHKKKRNSYKCEICKKIFKKSSLLVKHTMKKHSKVTAFTCDRCGKEFTSQIPLNAHIRKVHLPENDKPYKCDICSKGFEKKQGLSSHAKSHLDEQSYVCQYCNKTFSKISYLKSHKKCHVGEKDNFTCDTCAKDFKTSAALEEHSRKHTGEKPFTCTVCMKSFAYKAYFNVHIKKHAEVKPFTCVHCQKGFVTQGDLTKHEKTHAKEKTIRLDALGQSDTSVTLWKKQKCNGTNSQEVCTQTTTDFSDLQNVTLQNVNVIVDQSFTGQQPIFLTSIGGLINSNSVPVIFTQNPGIGSYSVSSIT
ncbi:hypothetical protein RUM43_012767 [Polyplax serrata]|uniref:C2H2-type domain-containing protein n=1 Tax=Polyplax serrata TaxID=468196 RepID=A0AAN8PIJ1_POLSC